MKNSIPALFYFFSLLILLSSCNGKISSSDFVPLINFSINEKDTVFVDVNLNNAIDSGISVPSKFNSKSDFFVFQFTVVNSGSSDKKYLYKIFYQNESYKFNEQELNSEQQKENYRAAENFYGSWENTSFTFKETPLIPANNIPVIIKDSFRIVGNPRNEKIYYGLSRADRPVYNQEIKNLIKFIQADISWFEQIKKRAAESKQTIDDRLWEEANYILKEKKDTLIKNNRWKRNPRAGVYEFMLVVTDEDGFNEIPEIYKDISLKKDSLFSNPFYYFLYGAGKDNKAVAVHHSNQKLKATIKFDLERGVYINKKIAEQEQRNFNYMYLNPKCNSDSSQYLYAPVEQFFHSINPADSFYQMPLIANLAALGYSKAMYSSNKNLYKNKLEKTAIIVTDCPCKTVKTDSTGKIIITNPAATTIKRNKENVGVITRYGTTYGKYRVKAKLPELLNKNLVWNGITNAIWLITQDSAMWNYRNPCYSLNGYIPKHIIGETSNRKKQLGYSEIDFEIVKSTHYWPKTSYKKGAIIPLESEADSANIMVTCTNWDLACNAPKYFSIGANYFEYEGKKYEVHRWDHWYKALTIKTPASDDELFASDYYWFEIEWKPNEIIWRIGPEKNKMRVVAYMNKDWTSIPNNQMFLVITQEYHLANWWPEAPFEQHFIPYPSNEISGEIYEIEIE